MILSKPTGVALLAAKRIQKENKWWGMHEKCCEQFPNLDEKTRAWLLYNSKGKAFTQLPLDQRVKINDLKNRIYHEFGGKLLLPSSGHPAAAQKKPCAPKAEKERAPLPADEEMAAIARADSSMCNTEIVEYWTNFISKYKAFQGKHGKPSLDSQKPDALYLAKGYEYCLWLANEGKLPLEIEILYSKINQRFDIVGTWRKKLETRNQMFFENGVQPSLAIHSQRHLAHWLYVVSNLHTRRELPYEPSWLSENFKPLPPMPKKSKHDSLIGDLRGYMKFARIVDEENIRFGSPVLEASLWAEWRELVIKLHSKGELPQDLAQYLKASGAKFIGG